MDCQQKCVSNGKFSFLMLWLFFIFSSVDAASMMRTTISAKYMQYSTENRQYTAGNRFLPTVASYGCRRDEFQCINNKCIWRSRWCNGINDCGDNSDEQYCNTNYYGINCPSSPYQFIACTDNRRCIPSSWKCDGIQDCQDNSDEMNCLNKIEKIGGVRESRLRAQKWMLGLRENVNTSKEFLVEIHRAMTALYLSDETIFFRGNKTGENMSKDLNIHLLAALLRNKTELLSPNVLSMYINALLVSCTNPRGFFGIDLIAGLRQRMNQDSNFTNPFIFLTLCNAKENLTSTEISLLVDILEPRPNLLFWTDIQALAVMALACVDQRSQRSDHAKELKKAALYLKDRQRGDGSIETLHTTALVIQALFASGEDEEEWDYEEAVKFVLKNQQTDGSFGDFFNTFWVLPVLKGKSLLNMSNVNCKPAAEDDLIPVEDIEDKLGKKHHVQYSLWIGDKVDIAYTMSLRVTLNTTFFDVMRIAAENDYKYRFQWKYVSLKPYIYSVSGINNDAMNGQFWFLYTASKKIHEEIIPFDKGPQELIPEAKEHVIMWYKSISP